MKIRTLERVQRIPLPAEKVFAFFADAGNLDAITPPWLHFRIDTPLPIPMARGTLIDYRLKIHGLPVRWRTAITRWEPPFRFVDEQVRGPYRKWVHLHEFEEANGETLMRDRVEYSVPAWFLEPLVHGWFVGPDLRKIFDYRQQRIQEILLPGQQPEREDSPPK